MLKEIRKKQVLNVCKSLLEDYINILTKEEVDTIQRVLNANLSYEEAYDLLIPIVEKVWNYDLASGEYKVISWTKHPTFKESSKGVIFATISKKDDIITFCDAVEGMEYAITFKSLIGALEKDGATLFEDKDKVNEYTSAVIKDRAINSYNGATKLITPKELVGERDIDYKSKHNELILDLRYVKQIGPYVREEKRSL